MASVILTSELSGGTSGRSAIAARPSSSASPGPGREAHCHPLTRWCRYPLARSPNTVRVANLQACATCRAIRHLVGKGDACVTNRVGGRT
jgi:hypothetical protein